jgi:hypothetical protein
MLSTDGDPARQLTKGEYILSTGTFPRVDVYSHTMAGEPLMAYEWLAEVASAASHRLFGLAGPVLMYSAMIGLTFALLFAGLRARGHGLLLSAGLVTLAATTSAIGWVARPHIFTALALVLTWMLLDAWYRRELRSGLLWAFPPLFCIWANWHGGFLVGWIMLGAYVGADVLRALAGDEEPGRAARARLREIRLPALASLPVVILNPNGLGMFDHIVGHFRHRFVLQNTGEFLSPDFHSGQPEPFLFLSFLLLTIASVAWSSRRLTLHEGGLLLVFVFFALYSVRNIPLFAIVVTPILASQLDALPALPGWWGKAADRIGSWFARRERVITAVDQRTRVALWSGAVVCGLSVLAAVQHRAGQTPLGVAFDPSRLPVVAADYLVAKPPPGEGFSNQQWGGYLLHRLWPTKRVFIDGQTDFYGDELARQYLQVMTLSDGWRGVLDDHRVQWVVFNTDSGLVAQLDQGGGWLRVHTDPVASVFVRRDRT